jgi:hypothetical protein
MKIISYILACPDDCDTLGDAINSLSPFSDHIYLFDGGNVSLIHHPRHIMPVKEWIGTRPEYDAGHWGNSQLTIVEREFINYGNQRNYALRYLNDQAGEGSNWLVWIDSDEVCSGEMIACLRSGYLDTIPGDIEGVYVKWLNLVQDEQHCVGGHHSDWLAHPRIVKVNNHSWSGSVHEHMVINRDKLIRLDVRVIHSRALFRRRLLVQRSHPNIKNQPDPLWDDAVMELVPKGVSWTPLHWPEGEFPIDFHADARDYWTIK